MSYISVIESGQERTFLYTWKSSTCSLCLHGLLYDQKHWDSTLILELARPADISISNETASVCVCVCETSATLEGHWTKGSCVCVCAHA